jgi:predicted nucleotidyltransferase
MSDAMSELPPKIRQVIVELEKGLKDLYGDRFRGLLLYGSYARGTAWEGSDVDLLLLLEGPVDPVEEILRVQAVKAPLSLEAELVLSIVPVSIENFERAESTFLRVVRREAIQAAV